MFRHYKSDDVLKNPNIFFTLVGTCVARAKNEASTGSPFNCFRWPTLSVAPSSTTREYGTVLE